MIKLSDFVFQYLADRGVEDVFMLSGGGCMHLVNSLGKNNKIRYVCCLFEQAVSVAAGAYAQYRNGLGVGLVTTGPGGTNAITGVASAWTDSIPLLIISGQVKTSDISNQTVRTLGFQELDIVSVVKPITKYAVTVKNPDDIAYELEKCIHFALSGRPGPVWLDIPLDVQAAMIDQDVLKHFEPEEKNLTDGNLLSVWEMLKQAKRPVILAGYGIKTSKGRDDFYRLMEKLQIPVLLTWKAMDLLEEDCPYYYGRPGCIGQRCANFIQQNADLILTIGARLDFGQIGYEYDEFARGAKKIIVDIDQKELDKFKFRTDLLVNMDAGDFIRKLLDIIGEESASLPLEWKNYCDRLKKRFPVVSECEYKPGDGAGTYYLMEVLNKLTDRNTVFAPGNSGACSEIFCQSYKVKEGQRIVTTNTLGSMGTGLPAAIGACVSSGEHTTVCVNGDGGFQMNIQDLETIHRLNLPIKFFILNNGGYGSIRNSQNNYFGGFYVGAEASSGVTLPETERIAYAYKIPFFRITTDAETEEIVKKCLVTDGPVICELMVSKQEMTLPRTKSVVLENGKMKSMPLEDLYPFLDRKEFEQIMSISKGE